ncbi:MAG: hypothetical protein U0271_10010 [Polyangiaceae bacterium]
MDVVYTAVGEHDVLAPRDTDELRAALLVAVDVLSALHASGRVHGALSPELLRLTDAGAALVVLPDVDAHAFRARLRDGAPPGSVAFAAPEVVAGRSPTAPRRVHCSRRSRTSRSSGSSPSDKSGSSQPTICHLQRSPRRRSRGASS